MEWDDEWNAPEREEGFVVGGRFRRVVCKINWGGWVSVQSFFIRQA